MHQTRLLALRRLNQFFAFGSIAFFDLDCAQLVRRQHIVGINLKLPTERGLRFRNFVHAAIFRTKLFVKAGLCRGKLDGGFILRDGIHVPFGFGIRLREYAVNQPGI